MSQLFPDEFRLKDGASDGAVCQTDRILNWTLPDDFKGFLHTYNGGEGFLGGNYVILWAAEELDEFNADYQVEEYAPGLILFGSSGGGEAFAFDTRFMPAPVVKVPFIGMDLKYVIRMSDSFSQFLQNMKGTM